jgi:hypothetical protein
MHNPSLRRESHRAPGAQGHLIDDRAGDADRRLVRHGSPRNCGLLLECDHASLDGPGDSDNGLKTERVRKGRDAIRGGDEHLFGAGGELHHGGHDLVQVGRMVHGGNGGCQLEWQRWERLAHRRRRGGRNGRFGSDPCRLERRERFDRWTPDAVVVGLTVLHPVGGHDEQILHVREINTARFLRDCRHHVAGRRWEHNVGRRRRGGHLGFLRSEARCVGLFDRVEEQTPHVKGGAIALHHSLAQRALHARGVKPGRRVCIGGHNVAGCRRERILRRRRRSSRPSGLPSKARCLGLICRFEQLAPEPSGVGLAYLHSLVACCNDGVVHPRSVNAARRFRIRPLARRLNADPGLIDGRGHQFLG